MEKLMSLSMGMFVAFLTLLGFVQRDKHFAGVMNVDTTHSAMRLPITLALLYGAKTNLKTTRCILLSVGAVYVGMGCAGLIDKKVGGLLPSKLTNFNIVYHLVAGAAAVYMGGRSGRMMKP
jgi:hypothetical protein